MKAVGFLPLDQKEVGLLQELAADGSGTERQCSLQQEPSSLLLPPSKVLPPHSVCEARSLSWGSGSLAETLP